MLPSSCWAWTWWRKGKRYSSDHPSGAQQGPKSLEERLHQVQSTREYKIASGSPCVAAVAPCASTNNSRNRRANPDYCCHKSDHDIFVSIRGQFQLHYVSVSVLAAIAVHHSRGKIVLFNRHTRSKPKLLAG
jgi:hypothetical protein